MAKLRRPFQAFIGALLVALAVAFIAPAFAQQQPTSVNPTAQAVKEQQLLKGMAQEPAAPGSGPAATVLPVVKLHVLFAAKAFPVVSLASVVTVAVKEVLEARLLSGVKTAVVPP